MAACAKLTCRNILGNLRAADELNDLAAKFIESYPLHIPKDDELAAISTCDTWQKKYDFDDMPPVSSDEATFPLAFNILTHQDVHQVMNRILFTVLSWIKSYLIY